MEAITQPRGLHIGLETEKLIERKTLHDSKLRKVTGSSKPNVEDTDKLVNWRSYFQGLAPPTEEQPTAQVETSASDRIALTPYLPPAQLDINSLIGLIKARKSLPRMSFCY